MKAYGLHPFMSAPMVPGLASVPPAYAQVLGLGVDSSLSAPALVALRGTVVMPSIYEEEVYDWSLFSNGVRVGVQQTAGVFHIPADSSTFSRVVDVIGAKHDPTDDEFATSDFFHARAYGDTVVLTWTDKPDDADFYAYLIYWDEGDGLGADTLLDTLTQKDLTQYVVEDLAADTYVFKILYQDVAGNIGNGAGGDNGATVSIVVAGQPDAPTISLNGAASFAAAAARSHTFTLTPPADTTGIVGYQWSLNQQPITGEVLNPDTALHRSRFRFAASTSLVLQLYAGTFKIAAFSVDRFGVLSDPTTLEFSYVDDGAGGLTFISTATPGRIFNIYAKPSSNGDIIIHAESDVVTGGGVKFYRNGTLVATVAFASASPAGTYEYTDAALVDGTEYTFKARAYFTSSGTTIYGEYSHEVTATADDTPPEGDQLLTARVRA